MPDKRKRIAYAIGGCIFILILLQTIYRWIYSALPQNLNSNPSAEYLATMNFFAPNSLTVVVIVIFTLGILYIAIFESE